MSDLPLKGVKVLDLSRLLPGPFCSLLLADLGAEVLKVEDTGMGDYVRWTPPYVGGEEAKASGTHSAQFDGAQPQQAVDPARPQDDRRPRRSCSKLVAEHDVVLESFRPGVLDKLGRRLRPDEDRQSRRSIYCAITGYGQDGPFTTARRTRHELPRPERPARD